MFDNGGDLVETAFLMEGLLTARQYLQRSDENLFRRISRLWETVEWDWYRRFAERRSVLALVTAVAVAHQSSAHRLQRNMIVYLLAIASPLIPFPRSLLHGLGRSRSSWQSMVTPRPAS